MATENRENAQLTESRTIVVARPTVVFKGLREFRNENDEVTYERVNAKGTKYSVMEFLLKTFGIDESLSEKEQEAVKRDIRFLAPRSNPFSNSDVQCRQISVKIYRGKESGEFFGIANDILNRHKTEKDAVTTTLEVCYNLIKTENGECKTRLYVQFPYVEHFTKVEADEEDIEEVKTFED